MGYLTSPEGSDDLTSVLLYHLISDQVLAENVPTVATDIETLNGDDITIISAARTVTINDDVSVETADVDATGVIIHYVDGVLVPPSFTYTCTDAPVTTGDDSAATSHAPLIVAIVLAVTLVL